MPAWLLLLCALPTLVEAAFVRTNCRGIQEFSMTDSDVSCQESSVLSDENQRLIGQNRKAGRDYVVLDTLECGVALVGVERRLTSEEDHLASAPPNEASRARAMLPSTQ